MPKVDIVVPCYNYGRYLEACVRSVLGQSESDLRVLIIDDASSDDSLLVANALAEADARVSVISHSQNWGHIRTYNQGIDWASAEYFLLLSADDLLIPGALKRATNLMEENADIVLAHGKFIEWYDHLPTPEIDGEEIFTWRRQDLIREMCISASCLVSTPTAVVRTSVQKTVGGYRASLPHTGDMEMWLRLAAQGSVARIESPAQAISRRHSSNMSTPYFAEKLPDFEQCKKAFDLFFEEYGRLVPGLLHLQAQATRTLTGKVYISGVAKICHGNISKGVRLLRYSMRVNPRLRFFPPIGLAMRLKAPKLSKLTDPIRLWERERP
jgi:hypothetical protein